jgi:hypothetical protein
MRKVEAYVFVDTENPGPKRVVREIRTLDGVVRADALLGTPDIVVIVEGSDIAEMDGVIDRIAELEGGTRHGVESRSLGRIGSRTRRRDG